MQRIRYFRLGLRMKAQSVAKQLRVPYILALKGEVLRHEG